MMNAARHQTTNETLMKCIKTEHVNKPQVNQCQSAFHKVAWTFVNNHSIQYMHQTITFTDGIEARSKLRTCG